MAKDLTNSVVERQNILNNHYALSKAEEHLGLGGIAFKGEYVFTKDQVVDLFSVSESTIEKYLANYSEELTQNGYMLLKGKTLKEFKDICNAAVIGYGSKVTVLGLFSFRAVLNLAMLLTESERAKAIRSRLLDIVLDVLAERVGGKTTYINQRDEHYLLAAYQEEGYRKQFTDAVDNFVEGNQ